MKAPSWEDIVRMMQEQGVDDPSLVLGAYGDFEEWKPVPDFPGYEFSNCGRLKGKSGRILRPFMYNEEETYDLVRDRQKHKWAAVALKQLIFPNPVVEEFSKVRRVIRGR